MPANEAAARDTDRQREAVTAARDRVIAALETMWHGLDMARLDSTFEAWLESAVDVLALARRDVAQRSAHYLAAYLTHSLGVPVAPTALDLDVYGSGRASDGRPLAETLRPALYTVKLTAANGRPVTQSLLAGIRRAQRVAGTEVVTTSRLALVETMGRDGRVTGWRRVTAPDACGGCLASATGENLSLKATFHSHFFCRCGMEPVVRGVREGVVRPTGREVFFDMTKAEQDRLFAGRGGEAKADLLRSGAVSFASLLERVPQATGPDLITEASLASLRS